MKVNKILAVLLTLALLLSAVGCAEPDSNGNPISSSQSAGESIYAAIIEEPTNYPAESGHLPQSASQSLAAA